MVNTLAIFEPTWPKASKLIKNSDVVVHCTCTCNIISHIVFAWEAVEHETDIHPQAEPTQLTLMHREFQNKKDGFKKDLQQSILDKYGGKEHLEIPAKELLLAQTVSGYSSSNNLIYIIL